MGTAGWGCTALAGVGQHSGNSCRFPSSPATVIGSGSGCWCLRCYSLKLSLVSLSMPCRPFGCSRGYRDELAQLGSGLETCIPPQPPNPLCQDRNCVPPFLHVYIYCTAKQSLYLSLTYVCDALRLTIGQLDRPPS